MSFPPSSAHAGEQKKPASASAEIMYTTMERATKVMILFIKFFRVHDEILAFPNTEVDRKHFAYRDLPLFPLLYFTGFSFAPCCAKYAPTRPASVSVIESVRRRIRSPANSARSSPSMRQSGAPASV